MISYLIGAHTTRLDNMIWKHWCVPPPTWWLCKLALQDFFWSCVAVILLIKYVLRYSCEKDKSVKYILDAGFGLGGPIKDMLRKWTTRCAMAERKRRKNKTLPSSLVGKKVTKKKSLVGKKRMRVAWPLRGSPERWTGTSQLASWEKSSAKWASYTDGPQLEPIVEVQDRLAICCSSRS